jgi:glyoxylate/hydroxypyruvate reductase A
VHFAVIRHARGIAAFERAQRRHEWKYVHPRPLSATKVGILGLGRLGSAAAASLAQIGFDVTGWARTQKTLPGVHCVAGRAALDDVLAASDIVVILLPLTHETRGLIGARELALLPHGAKLINAARGAIVDEAALLDALRSGQVGEATLDALTVEPLPPEHPFWGMENVLITPHIASITFPEQAVRDVVESIRRVRAGAKPLHSVDLRRGY